MAKEILFNDFFKIKLPAEDKICEFKDNLLPTEFVSKKGLDVTIEATHSALHNDNLRFYIPSRMQDGVDTFVNRRKPAKILKNHDRKADPVGIIVGAKYVPTVPPELTDDPDVKIMSDSSNDIKKQLAAVKRFMQKGIPFKDGWGGLGYIELQARILDKTTQDQLLDGRFDSVSTSFSSTGGAYCSVCHQNLADGMCEHEPGKFYSDDEEDKGPKVPCCVIPASHKYEECSICGFAADPITVIRIDGINDSVTEYNININDFISENSNFELSFCDIQEEPMGSLVLADNEKDIFVQVKSLRPDLDDEKALELTKKILEHKTEDGKFAFQVEAGIDDVTAIQYLLDGFDFEGQELDPLLIDQELIKEFEVMAANGEIKEELLNDAKLSASEREKLSEGVFCGPARSFPCPDCAHVTAARRLIGRYKGPGDKTRILACVNSKAKALGCDEKQEEAMEEDKAPEAIEAIVEVISFKLPTCAELSTATNEDVSALFALAEAEGISRNIKIARECSSCADFTRKVKELEEENKRLTEETDSKISDMQKEIAEKATTLKILRSELQRQYVDYSNQIEQYIKLGKALNEEKLQRAAILSVLGGKNKDIQTACDSLRISDVDKEITILSNLVKIEDVVTKINDGMARIPNEKVENPVANVDNKISMQYNGLSVPAQAAIKNIKLMLTDAKKTKDKETKKYNLKRAHDLYAKMVAVRVLDANLITFEALSANCDDVAE